MSLGTLVAAIGAAALTGGGCYKPSVVNGKLLCGLAGACPDDYSCVEGHCWRGGVVVDGGTPDDGPGFELGNCVQPLCTPTIPVTGACDPVCQTGCLGCDEKCTIDTTGVAACVKVGGAKKALEGCDIETVPGSNVPRDNCAPGSVCLNPDYISTSSAWCFTLCASDNDCPGSRCVPRPVAAATATSAPVAQVCDVPFTECDPIKNTGCTDPDRKYCYLIPPDPGGASRTVCEFTTGNSGAGKTCAWSRDCFPKLVCPPTVGRCVAPCTNDGSVTCTVGTCQPYGATYGYCN